MGRDNAAWKAFKPLVTGAMAGMVATTCTQPLDTLKVRVQVAAASGKSVSPFAVASQTLRNEDVGGLFKGASLTSTRAMGSTFGTLAFNAQAKEMLQEAGAPGLVPVIGGSLIAGFASAFFSLPFDFVKTQVQKMKPDPVIGEMPYKGPMDCAAKQLKAGGILRLWAGFPTYYAKMAPQVGIALIMQDQIKGMWKAMGV